MSEAMAGALPCNAFGPSRDMSTREFRRFGHDVIEWAANYLADPALNPVLADCQPGDLTSQLPARGPEKGESMEIILRDFGHLILPFVTHWNHPQFHGYFSISSSAPGILGELLMATLDVNAILWKSCPAATELEQVTASWVLDWMGVEDAWFGMILDSATSGALQALVTARLRTEPEGRSAGASRRLVVYVSEHTHSSAEKAAITAGIGQSHIRRVAADSQFRMRTDALRHTIQSDVANSLLPFFVVATVGTTSSTAVDPVGEIAAVCHEHGLWLHVDAAYGGAFGIVPECRSILAGIEEADSLVVSPQKTMMVPLDCSLFYTRHPDLLKSAFALDAEYLKTDIANVVDYTDYGLAAGRRFRALKLWLVLRYFGRDGLIAILRENLAMASWLSQRIAADPQFELMAPATMGLVCFRLRRGDAATRELMNRINSSGRFFVSHTVLGGHFTIRMAIGNIRTRQGHIEELWSMTAGVSRGKEMHYGSLEEPVP